MITSCFTHSPLKTLLVLFQSWCCLLFEYHILIHTVDKLFLSYYVYLTDCQTVGRFGIGDFHTAGAWPQQDEFTLPGHLSSLSIVWGSVLSLLDCLLRFIAFIWRLTKHTFSLVMFPLIRHPVHFSVFDVQCNYWSSVFNHCFLDFVIVIVCCTVWFCFELDIVCHWYLINDWPLGIFNLYFYLLLV